LQKFASRFGKPEDQELSSGKSESELLPSPNLTETSPVDHRDQAHLLLVERCDLIDQVFQKLPQPSRIAIVRLVRDMAGGMIWAKRVFDNQGGILRNNSQLRHYSNAVLGNPVAFAMRLMVRRELSHQEKETAMNVGELIQLANVTRDIEKDLRRGVAYHPALEPWLSKDPEDASDIICEVRSELFDLAMSQAPAYRKMVEGIPFRWISLSRASSILMLDFTDRYYRSCAKRISRPSWPGPQNSLRLLMGALPAFLSRGATSRRVRKVEKAFLNARQSTADLH
jgi:phytoene/squalene synthetase